MAAYVRHVNNQWLYIFIFIVNDRITDTNMLFINSRAASFPDRGSYKYDQIGARVYCV